MELQGLDQQLKVAIQNHQMLVGKMKADPQNGVLQKQLHELQAHIRTLSERQKQVVQQHRKDLETKKMTVLSSNAVSSTSLSNHTQNLMKSLPQTAPLSLTTKRSPAKSAAAITLPAAILLSTKSNIPPPTTTATAVSSTNGGDPGGRTPLAPVIPGAVTVNANHHHHPHHHHHHHNPHHHSHHHHLLLQQQQQQQQSPPPVTTAVPNSTDGRGGLSSPIRVPQYPPPATTLNHYATPWPSSAHNINNNNNNSVNCCQQRSPPTTNGSEAAEEGAVVAKTSAASSPTSSASTVSTSPSATEPCAAPADVHGLPPTRSPSSLSLSVAESLTVLADAAPLPVPPPPVKVAPAMDPAKTNFMAALGLITPDMVSELRNRRTERKRRTTANPQFSYGNWDCAEKKTTNNKYLSHSLPSGFKRPRGRPRLGSTTPTGSRPSTPEDYEHNGALVNGLSTPPPARHNGMSTAKELEDTCMVCRRGGDLLSCEACFESYHVRCVVEESGSEDITKITLKLKAPWICPRCLVSLIADDDDDDDDVCEEGGSPDNRDARQSERRRGDDEARMEVTVELSGRT